MLGSICSLTNESETTKIATKQRRLKRLYIQCCYNETTIHNVLLQQDEDSELFI